MTDAPPATRPLRLAFVGQSTFFRACALDEHSDRVETAFVEFRSDRDPRAMRAALDGFGPDAVVVFRPEVLPPAALADVPAPILGFLTEPIVRDRDGRAAHWDLQQRRRDLASLDPANVDRLVSFDPLIVDTVAEFMPVWRSAPLPVADRLYRPVRGGEEARMLFVGRSTLHREEFLLPIKHRFDLLHVAFGADVDELEGLLERHSVTFNIHNEPYPSFENRVLLHLAAGHLIVSEPLSPTHGLHAGADYLEAATPGEFAAAAGAAHEDLDQFLEVRASGRAKAEEFRASAVWPGLAADLAADIAASRSHRRR